MVTGYVIGVSIPHHYRILVGDDRTWWCRSQRFFLAKSAKNSKMVCVCTHTALFLAVLKVKRKIGTVSMCQ